MLIINNLNKKDNFVKFILSVLLAIFTVGYNDIEYLNEPEIIYRADVNKTKQSEIEILAN